MGDELGRPRLANTFDFERVYGRGVGDTSAQGLEPEVEVLCGLLALVAKRVAVGGTQGRPPLRIVK